MNYTDDALYAYSKRCTCSVINCLERPGFDVTQEIDWLLSQVDYLKHHTDVAEQLGVLNKSHRTEIDDVVTTVENLYKTKWEQTSQHEIRKINEGKGRPRYDIRQEQLQLLLTLRFNIPDISKILGGSKRTIKWRMSQYQLLKTDNYTNIKDESLDKCISDIQREFPRTGYRRMIGYLRAKNILVPERRVREFMRRVDLEGALLQSLQLTIINRRHYSVSGTNALWHIDGNHKLIRYRKTLITFY